MAETSKIVAAHVLKEHNNTPGRSWNEYLIAAPGSRVTESMSSTMAGAGGLVGGFLALMVLMGSPLLWLAFALLIAGIPLGVGYAKLVNRFSRDGRLLARGRAVRLLGGPKINEEIVQAAIREVPGYFAMAQRAARLDEVRERLRRIERDPAQSAETAVRRDELERGERALRLLVATDALSRASALLAPSDAAIDAAGAYPRVVYGEIAAGDAQIFDANH